MVVLTGIVAVASMLFALGSPPGAPPEPRGRAVLDGYVLGRSPPGIGPRVSDHAYEWGDDPGRSVAFRSRVWERGPDAAGGYHVDFTVEVLRGKRLSDPEALKAFLSEYLERDAGTWRARKFAGRPGFTGADDACFLDRPGVAVYTRLEKPGAEPGHLMRFTEGVHRDV